MPKSRTRLSRARAILSRLYRRHSPTPQKQAQFQYDRSPPSTPSTPSTSDSPSSHKSFHKSYVSNSSFSSSSLSRSSFQKSSRPPSPRAITSSLLRHRHDRARSDIHLENNAMQQRLAQLETIETENSSLRIQLDDLQRALDGVQNDNHSRDGQLEMADIENASLRFQLDCLKAEFQRPFSGPMDVVGRRLDWLNVEPV